MKHIGEFLNRLSAYHVRADGTNHWQSDCPCPGHATPAKHLSITFVPGDKVLVKCMGSAHTTEDICHFLGLAVKDLFITTEGRPMTATAPAPVRNVVAEYNYNDENGDLLFQVVRFDPKGFSQRHRNGNGDWVWNMNEVRRVPYNLDWILAAPPSDIIYWVEGEKDADTLSKAGLLATTTPGGAGNFRPEYADYFRGRKVVLIPDKDGPGFNYANQVGQALTGVAEEIGIVNLPLETVKDVTDWVTQGGNVSELPLLTQAFLKTEQTEITEHIENTPSELNILKRTEQKLNKTEQPRRDKVLWPQVDEWLAIHHGESFNLDTITRQLGVTDREGRQSVAKKLHYETGRQELEKKGSLYTYIDKTCTYVDWMNADENKTFPLVWPRSHDDQTRFGFWDTLTVSPGEIIICAGVSNTGKSALAYNILAENMDAVPCTLFGNEIEPGKFKRRMGALSWADPLDAHGKPKFETIARRDRWKDVIRPENLNIIDWMMVPDNFYQIGSMIDGIQSALKGGICWISIQKDPNKMFGVGGMFGEHLASVYLAMDFNRLTVIKAKQWSNGYNPNGRMYGFELTNYGTCLTNIREVKKCGRCHGSGTVGKDGAPCLECDKGYKDVESQ